MRLSLIRTLPAWIAILIIGCDQGTKHLAANTLADHPGLTFFGDTFRLIYAENTGAFLGLGGHWPATWRNGLFVLGTALLLALCLIALWRYAWSLPRLVGLSLFIAGGASNWIDRALRGSVIDFMNVGVGGLRTGIFNVADMAILLGIACWLWPEGRVGRPRPPEPSGEGPAGA